MTKLCPTRLRLKLAIIKHIDGLDYVTSKRIAKEFDDASPRHVAHAIPALKEAGDVTLWSETSPATYRIEL